MKHALQVAVVFAVFSAACGGDDKPSYKTYNDCFDKQPTDDAVVDKLLECCTNADINGNTAPCGADMPSCTNYLTDNVRQSSAGYPEILDACTQYGEMQSNGSSGE